MHKHGYARSRLRSLIQARARVHQIQSFKLPVWFASSQLTVLWHGRCFVQRGPASQQLLEIKRKEHWRVKNFQPNSSRGVSLGVLFGNFERVNM